jgi:hypothetical protein
MGAVGEERVEHRVVALLEELRVVVRDPAVEHGDDRLLRAVGLDGVDQARPISFPTRTLSKET